ncbi:DUF6527 family protein [Curvibacter lanceolatus]|uniref:DUF6527 family protein n=1 Tax=Curvibacter lanceolatus TaxID=86182 RepID=UPI000378EF33|nr:DUF6527 family protein [Curvibacter lanceolatus]
MSQISPQLRSLEGDRLAFWCPGCKESHQIAIGEGSGPRWGYNGNSERPTFTPSVLVWWDEPKNIGDIDALNQDIAEARARREAGATGEEAKVPYVSKRCHSFVTDGRIQFLSDCTHELAGQTVDLPPWPSQ